MNTVVARAQEGRIPFQCCLCKLTAEYFHCDSVKDTHDVLGVSWSQYKLYLVSSGSVSPNSYTWSKLGSAVHIV